MMPHMNMRLKIPIYRQFRGKSTLMEIMTTLLLKTIIWKETMSSLIGKEIRYSSALLSYLEPLVSSLVFPQLRSILT